jgi:hypothetical protein
MSQNPKKAAKKASKKRARKKAAKRSSKAKAAPSPPPPSAEALNKTQGRTRASVFERFPELRAIYLKHLARYGNKVAAAKQCRCSEFMVNQYAERHPEFHRQEREAQQEYRARIEEAIHERAIDGWLEPKYGQGGQIGTVRKFSDQLLIFHAKRHIQEYRQAEKTEVSGTVEHKHQHAHRHQHTINVAHLSGKQREALRILLADEEEETEQQ